MSLVNALLTAPLFGASFDINIKRLFQYLLASFLLWGPTLFFPINSKFPVPFHFSLFQLQHTLLKIIILLTIFKSNSHIQSLSNLALSTHPQIARLRSSLIIPISSNLNLIFLSFFCSSFYILSIFSQQIILMDFPTKEKLTSSSSSTRHWSYDIFLSFRCKDTRYGFTGHLYTALCDNGLITFIDNNLLGEKKFQ